MVVVGEQHALLGQHPGCKARRPQLIELLLGAGAAATGASGGSLAAGELPWARTPAGLVACVDDGGAEVAEDARGAIALARPAEQLRVSSMKRVVYSPCAKRACVMS